MTDDKNHHNRDRCFFCLHPVQNPHPANSNSRSTLTKQLTFLFRHLNLNVTSATKSSSDFEASLCPGCTDLINDFFNWYQQLELDRMFVNSIIGQINDVINNGAGNNNQEQDKTDLFGRMRTNLIDKCNQHLKKATPRVTLTRVDVEALGAAIKVNEQLMNMTETENCDQDGDSVKSVMGDGHDDDDDDQNDHSDIHISQDEPLEDLHAEDDDDENESLDDESKIKSESLPDAEVQIFSEKVPDTNPSQYRKPRGSIASSETWQAPGDIFKDHVTTKYYRAPHGGFQRRYVYTCKLCNAQVYDKPAHRSFHRNETPFECPHCDLGKYTDSRRLRYHLLINHPEQNFLQFKERTLSQEKFKIAVKMLFEGLKFTEDRKSRLCPHCDQKFGARGSIIGHMIEKHHCELVVRLDSLQENTELLEKREQRLKKFATTANKKIQSSRKSKMNETEKSEPQEEPHQQKSEAHHSHHDQDSQDQLSIFINSILGPKEKTDLSTENLTLHFESREENAGKVTPGQDKGQGRPGSIKRKLSAENNNLNDHDDEREKSWDHFLRKPRKQAFKVLRDEADIDKNLPLAPKPSSSSSADLMQCPYCSENGFWKRADLHGHLVDAHLEQFFIFVKQPTISLDSFKVMVNLLFANIKMHMKYVPMPRSRFSRKKKVGHFHCDYCDSKTSIFRETFKTRSELKGHMIQIHLELLLERLNELQEKEIGVAVGVDVDVSVAKSAEPAPEIVQIDDDDDPHQPEPEQPEMAQAPPICDKNGIPQTENFIVPWKLQYVENKQGLKEPVQLYYCKLCNKVVRNLSAHRRNHFGIKSHSYKCRYCNARFLQSTNLDRHIATNHLEKIFEGSKFPSDRNDAEFGLILEGLFRKLSVNKRECEITDTSNSANDQEGGLRKFRAKFKFVCVFCDQAIGLKRNDLKHHLAFMHYNEVTERLKTLQQEQQQQQEVMTPPSLPQLEQQEQELSNDWNAVTMNFEGNHEQPEESVIVKFECANGEVEQDPLFI